MSTVVCHNLTETTTTLKLKLAATAFDHSTNQEFKNRGLGFLQATPKESGDYYRWDKKSSFPSLSAKSLELCTENLGSETGCDAISDSDSDAAIFPTASRPTLTSISTPHPKGAVADDDEDDDNNSSNWKHITRFPKTRNQNFPPPLTSSLQVRRRSEGGRLIIEAVEAPLRNSYMQAERRDGRLRLCFLTADTTASAFAGEEESGGETAAAEEEEEESELEEEIGVDGDVKRSVEMEMESEKYEWASRCKQEGGHRNQWKPAVWVAIS